MFKSEIQVQSSMFKLEFKFEFQFRSSSSKFKFEVQFRISSSKFKFKVQVRSSSSKFKILRLPQVLSDNPPDNLGRGFIGYKQPVRRKFLQLLPLLLLGSITRV